MRLSSFALAALWGLCAIALSAPSRAQQHPCDDPKRIVGGDDADIMDHPWQVALDVEGALCGGVIVRGNWVLTAAHCFDSDDPRKVKVKAGATDYRIGGVWTPVDRVVLHKFDRSTKENDLALVKLRTRPAGRSIPFAKPDLELARCQPLEVTGWGRTEAGKRGASQKLQKADVPYIDIATCNEPKSYNGKIGPSMICAGYHAKDACQGDSGGPLVYKGPDGPVLVGIVSWGESCGKQFKYGVYTRVTAHRDWILKVIDTDGK
jgi:secreted trypsin-like serine protease